MSSVLIDLLFTTVINMVHVIQRIKYMQSSFITLVTYEQMLGKKSGTQQRQDFTSITTLFSCTSMLTLYILLLGVVKGVPACFVWEDCGTPYFMSGTAQALYK